MESSRRKQDTSMNVLHGIGYAIIASLSSIGTFNATIATMGVEIEYVKRDIIATNATLALARSNEIKLINLEFFILSAKKNDENQNEKINDLEQKYEQIKHNRDF